MSYWSFEQQISKNDVLYYGVLGMKWGQHYLELKHNLRS